MNEQVKEVMSLILRMRPWSTVKQNDKESLFEIEKAVKKISEFDINIIKQAEEKLFSDEEYKKQRMDTNFLSKFFVLHRYLFNVPEWTNPDQQFSSFAGVEIQNDKVNELWPWQQENGTLRLTGFFKGYFGEVYQVLSEFNYFLKNFGARKL